MRALTIGRNPQQETLVDSDMVQEVTELLGQAMTEQKQGGSGDWQDQEICLDIQGTEVEAYYDRYFIWPKGKSGLGAKRKPREEANVVFSSYYERYILLECKYLCLCASLCIRADLF